MTAADAILTEIDRGKIRPVYLLLGEDRGSKEEVIAALKGVLFKSPEEITSGATVFYGDEAPVHEIVESLHTSSKWLPAIRGIGCRRQASGRAANFYPPDGLDFLKPNLKTYLRY